MILVNWREQRKDKLVRGNLDKALDRWMFRNLNLIYNSICKIISAFQSLTLVSGFATLSSICSKYQFLGFQSHMSSKRDNKYFQISQEFAYVIIGL